MATAGYDVLASILYQKSRLINMTTFEILFEFLGLSFRSPEYEMFRVYLYCTTNG